MLVPTLLASPPPFDCLELSLTCTGVGLALGKLGYNVYGMRKAVENIERDAPLWIEAAKAKHGNPEKIEPYGQDEFDKLTGQCDVSALSHRQKQVY